MPYILEDLRIERVDFVDEGSNSAAFIELYKRKEQSNMELKDILEKMKPEHSEVVSKAIDEARNEATVAKAACECSEKACGDAKKELEETKKELEETKKELEKLQEANKEKSGAQFDETETLKSMPAAAREMFETLKAQKEAAEAEIRKAKEDKDNAEAIAKANELKSLPIEHDKLVSIIKGANADVVELLTLANNAINSTVLDEVGKSCTGANTSADAWAKIDSKADEIVVRDSVTKSKAISIAIKENPDMYREYLKGGAN